MPTYVYACTSCGERLEAVQRISDDPLTVCPACNGTLRKVIQPVGIVFKGSGFYKTDSRSSGKSDSKPSEAKTESKADSSSTSDSSSATSPAKDSGSSTTTPPSGAAKADTATKPKVA